MAVKKPAPKSPAKKAAPKAATPARKKAKPPAKAEASPAVTVAAPIPETTLLPHNMIRPSKLNPRKTVREGYIEELAESLKATGQLQNISVRMHLPAPGQKGETWYEIIYGEQRWQAFRLLIERGDLPADHPMLCRVMWVDDGQHLELAILENQAREDVHPLEQAEAYARLAEIRRKETGDDKSATRIIAERTGQTTRNVQFYLQVAANLSDEAKEAWREGRIRNRKIAIELARWPHDIQNDAIEDILFEDVSDPSELRRWMEEDAPPVSAARFSLEEYLAAGGVIVSGEEGEPDRLANKGLAGRLQREWTEAEAARISQAKGYGLAPASAESSWGVDSHPWIRAPKGTPKSAQGVRYHINPYTLEVTLKHPLANAKVAAAATMRAAIDDRPGETPLEDLPQPYARRNWMAGAIVRTRHVRREIIAQDRRAALAIALMALLPREEYTENFCGLRWDNATGDAGEVSRAAGLPPMPACHALTGLPGFNEDGEIEHNEDAMVSLLSLGEFGLMDIFAELIAKHSVDASCMIAPGAKTETRVLESRAGTAFGAQDAPLCTAEWLKGYTISQLMALAEESGAADAMRAEGKTLAANRAWLVSELPAYIPASYIPPEARILPREEAEQAVAAMLARKAPS